MLSLTPSDFAFEPDAQRAARLDERVRRHLADSLAETLAACEGHLSWPREAAGRLLAEIRERPVRAVVMAIYADLVEAVFRDDLAGAQSLLDELLAAERQPPARRVKTMNDASLGPGQAARYMRIVSDDPAAMIYFNEFEEDRLAALEPVFEAAFALLDEAAPELAGEVRAFTREIVLVDGSPRRGASEEIGGVSSFYLWGAPILNLAGPPSRLSLAEALTHEAAHHLLFGLALGKPLVSNPAEERYPSPLRDDDRPMDGIVHAAYVIARMTWCMDRLLDGGGLSGEEAATARLWRERNRHDFDAALGIIRAHGRLTPVGEAAFAGAAEFMERRQAARLLTA